MHFPRVPRYVALILLIAACTADSGSPTTTSAPESSPPTDSQTTVVSTTTTTVVETTTTSGGLTYRWVVGDCLRFGELNDLPYEPFGSEPLTTCEEGHTHEVYHAGSFSGGQEAAYPGGSIDSEISETCIGTFIDLFGFLPVESELDILMYLPDEDEWASGLRYQGCLVYLPAGLGRFRELNGSVAGRGEDFVLETLPGDCFTTPDVKIPSVDCDQPHLAEVIGTVTYPGETGASYPGGAELELFAARECDAVRTDYVVENERADTTVAFAPAFSEPEWDSGWRDLRCLAFAVGTGGGIVQVTGSFAEANWTVVEGGQSA